MDKNNGNKHWYDDISKETKNANPYFKILENGERVTIGYQQVNIQMVSDVSMEYFTRKANLVYRGHTN